MSFLRLTTSPCFDSHFGFLSFVLQTIAKVIFESGRCLPTVTVKKQFQNESVGTDVCRLPCPCSQAFVWWEAALELHTRHVWLWVSVLFGRSVGNPASLLLPSLCFFLLNPLSSDTSFSSCLAHYLESGYLPQRDFKPGYRK